MNTFTLSLLDPKNPTALAVGVRQTHLESEDVKPEHVEDLLWFHPGGEKVMVLDLSMFLVYEEMVYKVVEAML